MSDEAAKMSFFASQPPPDPRHPAFEFKSFVYVKTPELFRQEMVSDEDIAKRKAEDRSYRNAVSPTTWNRYILLGYQTTTGEEFAKIWRERHLAMLTFHRAIWYNYLSYVDRGHDTHEKLYFWAHQVAHPFLRLHDPDSLEMDIERFTWQTLKTNWDKQEKRSQWIPVGKQDKDEISPDLDNDQMIIDKDAEVYDPSSFLDEEDSGDTTPMGNATAPPSQTMEKEDDEEQSKSDAKRSAVVTRHDIATNDGTHRLTFKWKLTKTEYSQVAGNKVRLHQEIFAILKLMFKQSDGHFYRWESENMIQANTIDEMNSEDVVQFLAPAISTLPSHNLIIFAARFAFQSNPITWKNKLHTQEAMKLNNIQMTVSNSKTTSGKLVIAGYIILKHATMTHRHRFLMYLRSIMPDSTPFFDIVYHRKTPADQNIGHLAVQCGEHHVQPLSEILSATLNGQKTAIYLPRLAFLNKTTDQIKDYFIMQDNYVKSLHQIPLSPMVSNIDTMRIEYFPDGTSMERTTREWALSLNLANGNQAQCDVENGGKDKLTYLLAPAAYAAEVKSMVTQYKDRLQTIAKREARFRESLPDLPEVIHYSNKPGLPR